MAAVGEQHEVELTLRVDRQDVDRLLSAAVLGPLQAGRARRRRLLSVYFDTPEGRLRDARIALRVRTIGKRHVQTVKAAAAASGPSIQRDEWEHEVGGELPEIAPLQEIRALRRIFGDATIAAALRPVYVSDLMRTTVPLRLGDSRLELAVDVGEIRAGERSEPVCEIEIELQRGRIADVYAAADALRRVVPLRLESLSKSERGQALAASTGPQPRRAERLRLEADVSVGDAFRAIVRSCLIQLRANAAAVERSDDAEGMHQLRVALRRLRSAFSAFAAAMPAPERRRFASALKRVARVTDTARELDVFLDEILLAVRKAVGRSPDLDVIADAALRARARAWARVRAMLASDAFLATVLALEGWLEGGGWRSAAGAAHDQAAAAFARRTLKRLHRKLTRMGDDLAALPEAELHDVRLRAKKLRYAAEFFRDLFAPKPTKRYLAALADVQDHLGSLNDNVTVRALLGRLARTRGLEPAAFDRGAALVLGWSGARVAADLEELPATWTAFRDCRSFWK